MISNNFFEYVDRSNIDQDLICEFCHEPFIDPIVTQRGYTYCRQCIEQRMDNNSSSPSQSCNESLFTAHMTSYHAPRIIISMVDKLKVRCQLCGETNLLRRNFDEHIKGRCPKYRVYCPRKEIGCPWFGLNNELHDHTKTCVFSNLKPAFNDFHELNQKQSIQTQELIKQQRFELEEIIKNQEDQLERLKKEAKEEMQQKKVQHEELIQQQKTQIENIQSENQNQNNEIASLRRQNKMFEDEINKLNITIRRLRSNVSDHLIFFISNYYFVHRSLLEA